MWLWVLKNPVLSGALAALVSVSVYAGVQKVGRMSAELKLGKCEQAITLQNAAIDELKREGDRLQGELHAALLDAEDTVLDSEFRIEALLRRPVGKNCQENVGRFIDGLGDIRWGK